MIIVIKDKDTAYVAASIECTYTAMHTDDIINEENLKMWHPHGKDNCIIAIPSCCDVCIDNLRYADIEAFDKSLDSRTMILEIAPAIKDIYKEQNLLDDDNLWSEIVVAKNDKAFTITPNLTICDIEDFDVLGYGDAKDMVFAVLEMTKDLPPLERIAEAFRTVELGAQSIHFPIVVMNTKTNDRTVIYE